MKKIRKSIIFLIILTIISSMFVPIATSAATVSETKLNIRTSTKYKYMNNWAYPNNRNGIHLATVAEGEYKGEPAYCIEFGKDMGDDEQYETIMDIDKVPAWEEFNANQKSGITRATIYGYPNFNYGVSAEATQVATQFVVWEYSQGYRTSADGNNPTAGLNGSNSKIDDARKQAGFDVRQQYYLSGVEPYSDVETAYKGILNGIKNHRVIPSFNSDTVELNWNSKNERFEASVEDANGVLSLYEISSKNTSLKFSKSGNTLTIYTKDVLNSSTEVTMSKICAKVGADIGFVPPNQNYNQSLTGRLTDPVKAYFNIKVSTGNCEILKTSEDEKVDNVKFNFKGNGIDKDVVTDSKGRIFIENIPVGVYTVTEYPIDKYVTPKSQTVVITNGQTSTVNFSNILKKFRVKVVKSDIEKGKAQGDAKLSGAKYGIYKGEQLIDTYTTDNNASFTTKYYICDTDWTIRELESSEGYLVNDEIYKVGADPKLYKVEYNTTANDVVEMPIKNRISIIKHSDDGSSKIETPEVNAEFQVYLKSSGSYDKADPDERDILVTNKFGFAITKLLPYGTYTVHQTKGTEGTEYIADFDVFIDSEEKEYKYLINDPYFYSFLKVVKTDTETGKQIAYAGAGFEIYKPNGEKVEMTYTYPTPTTIDTFYTNSEGYLVTPEKLIYGKGYKLVEVQAPYGYVCDSTPISFDITQEHSTKENALTIVKVERPNLAQKGVIEITKEGEIFSSVGVLGGGYIDENGNDIEFPITYSPIYETRNLANAVFQIYAAEDIVTLDGTVRAVKGELVDEITTADNGIAKSKQLYLGKYTVIEKTAPDTFVNANEQYDVELTYAGQDVKVTSTALSVFNERQKVTVSLLKELSQDERFKLGMNDEILSVQFGIFADEDIKAADGSVIPKDALISYGNCDENGKLTFNCDLPIGFKWYAKEIATDEHYILSDAKHEFDTYYKDQETEVININLNNGEPIINDFIYGTIKGLKVDRETEKTIEGALFGLFNSDETEFTEDNAILTALSDKNGIFTFENIPYGNWIVKELKPAENYLPSDDIHHITVTDNEQLIEIKVVNDRVPELKTTATVDGEKETTAKGEITIDDVVEYKHLIPGKEYTIVGTLMDKSTGKPFEIDGKPVTSEVTFTPEKSNGKVTVSFTFDASTIKETTELVVFETLYREGVEIAVHADIDDKGQTVKINVPAVNIPKTGDNSKIGLWITVAGASLILLVSLIIKNKKTHKKMK